MSPPLPPAAAVEAAAAEDAATEPFTRVAAGGADDAPLDPAAVVAAALALAAATEEATDFTDEDTTDEAALPGVQISLWRINQSCGCSYQRRHFLRRCYLHGQMQQLQLQPQLRR